MEFPIMHFDKNYYDFLTHLIELLNFNKAEEDKFVIELEYENDEHSKLKLSILKNGEKRFEFYSHTRESADINDAEHKVKELMAQTIMCVFFEYGLNNRL